MIRIHPLSFSIASLLLVPSLVWAQEAASDKDTKNNKDKALEEVVVTGTRASDRTVGESLAPIDLLDAKELQSTGTPEVNAALARFVPSFNFPRPSVSDGTDHVRPAQLRGLAPDQTLVLINGKRRHTTAIVNVNGTIGRGSSPVDLNAIPAAAIERIEVLRDGASAQYGSDAIAGVINVVLKDSAEGANLDSRYGITDSGDGELIQGAAHAGFAWGDGGFVNLTAEYRDRGGTNRAGLDTRQQYPLVNGQPDPREATFNRKNHWFGDGKIDDTNLFLNASHAFGDDASLYAFGNFGKREGIAAGFYRRALDARNIIAIYPDGFLPMITSDVDDRSLVAGLRGAFANGWSYDFSLDYGHNEFDFGVENSLNVSLGSSSPTEFYAGTLANGQLVANADFVRGFDIGGWAYPLNVAVGAEYRSESYEISPGEPDSYFGSGAQVFPGFRPSDATDESRHSFAVYADLEAPVTEALTLSGALRYEDYSDFGNTTAGKLSARYAFNDAFAVRGTVSTGFRAPSLAQQYFSTTATNFIGGVPFDVRTFAVTNPVAIALGAEPLKAEESTNYSLGFVATPFDGFSVTVDAYQIEIDDRVILSENLTGAAVRDFLAANGFPNTDGGRYFTNAVDTETTGFDVIGRYLWDLGDIGETTLTLGYNKSDTDIVRIAANPPELTAGGLNLQRIGRVEVGRITEGSPDDKWVFGADWTRDAWSARIGATRYGQYVARQSDATLDQTFGSELVVDISGGYRFDNGLGVTLGVDNVTDAYPDKVLPGVAFSGILQYSRGEAPFGFNGAFYYARLNWEF